ncbi:lysozyme inhibitor LprI family protein [Massilia sp. B-10]|nr:lysozyme inhibitor LprI family protein [Massilia sp. B-10]UUZ55314.1 lysozyme inhibitor LprI family protein [Massilia sp. H-1]
MQVEKVYLALVKDADDTRRPLLVKAHEAWRDYRMKQCSVEFDLTRIQHSRYPEHGTAAPSYERSCLIRLNDTRLIELNVLAETVLTL